MIKAVRKCEAGGIQVLSFGVGLFYHDGAARSPGSLQKAEDVD